MMNLTPSLSTSANTANKYNSANHTTMLTRTTSKLEQQKHTKPLLSPTRSLDEGFESDPDRLSTHSEHQVTSGTSVESSSGNGGSCNSSNIGSTTSSNSVNGQTKHQHLWGSNLAQLSSAAIGIGSSGVPLDVISSNTTSTTAATTTTTNSKPNSVHQSTNMASHPILNMLTLGKQTTNDLHKQRLLSLVTAQTLQSRRQTNISKSKPQQQQLQQQQHQLNSNNQNINNKVSIPRAQQYQNQSHQQLTSAPTQQTQQLQQQQNKMQHTINEQQKEMQQQQPQQRLQYQKQRQTVVAATGGPQSIHNHRLTNGVSGNGNSGTASGFRRSRTRAHSPTASPFHQNGHTHHSALQRVTATRGANKRSHSLDAIARYRNNAITHTPTRMMNYKFPQTTNPSNSSVSNLSTTSGTISQTLLVQPMSSATLTSVATTTLPPATAVLNSASISDAAAALVAAAGGSPVIASATNSLYTFYPAEGNLQVWQSDCGDLTYKSSRQQQAHKAPVCWTQSIPRQTRR